jgi:hypothetical protein
VDGLTTQEAMFDAIVDERAFEFVGEFLRKQDLIRWNLLSEKMDETLDKMTDLSGYTGVYAELPNSIYYKYAEDEESIVIYGFNAGETSDPGTGWEKVDNYLTDAKGKTKLDLTKKVLYQNDPDTHMYWPIFENSVTNSQGYLKNDFGF